MGKLTTALKWFAYGIGLGLLFAPRSGQETRQQLVQTVSTRLSEAFNAGSQAAREASTKTQQFGDQAASTGTGVQESTTTYGSTTMTGGPV